VAHAVTVSLEGSVGIDAEGDANVLGAEGVDGGLHDGEAVGDGLGGAVVGCDVVEAGREVV